jgi:hypothetical protein
MNISIIDLLKKINLSNVISNTNKTLGIIKKTIPVYRQVKPYMTHEKSFLKKNVTNELVDKIKESKPLKEEIKSYYNDTLTFFK